MVQTLEEADAVVQAQRQSGKIVFVGYMRLYSPAYLRLKELVHEIPAGELNYGESWQQLRSRQCGYGTSLRE